MNNKGKKALYAVAGVALMYCYANGKGIFNRIRFKNEIESIKRYVETHYPGAKVGKVEAHDNGKYVCPISYNGRKILLVITKADNGMYVFEPIETEY